MSASISTLKQLCSEIKALISEVEDKITSSENAKLIIAEIANKFDNFIDIQKSYEDHKDPEYNNVTVEMESLRKKFIRIQSNESDESESYEIERHEIDLPDDVRSNGSSLLEDENDEKGETTETKSSQSDFLQSLIIAVGFCLLFAIVWSYFT